MRGAQLVARNTFWNGLEQAFTILGSIVTAVLVARHFGPTRLGYYNFLTLWSGVTSSLATLGLGGACRKYMSEYLGRGQPDVSYAVFWLTYRVQLYVSLAVAVGATLVAWFFARADHQLIAGLLMIGISPRILAYIPSCANMAAEDNAANVPGSLAGAAVLLTGTALSIWAGWELVGIAAFTVASYVVELGLKTLSVRKRFHGVEPASLDLSVRRRILMFSGQGLVLMVLGIVVWDKSDVWFLKWLNRDPAQMTFFTTGLGLLDKLMIWVNVSASSVVNRMLMQYGTDKSRVPQIAGLSGTYGLLLSIPVLSGAAAVAHLALPAVYGWRYAPLAPVFVVMALMGVVKALVVPGQAVFQAYENQGFLIRWGILSGVLNIGLDVLLVGRFGALGAAFANGVAQGCMALSVWYTVERRYGAHLRWRPVVKTLIASAVMAAGVVGIRFVVHLPVWWMIAISVAAGFLIFVLMIRLVGVLEAQDRERLESVAPLLPAWSQVFYRRAVRLVAAS